MLMNNMFLTQNCSVTIALAHPLIKQKTNHKIISNMISQDDKTN